MGSNNRMTSLHHGIMTSKSNDIAISVVAAASAQCRGCGCAIPLDEAVVPEALPYVVNFCGLDCYARWRVAATRAHIHTLSGT
jgi:Domain of unknown function (DUF3330)